MQCNVNANATAMCVMQCNRKTKKKKQQENNKQKATHNTKKKKKTKRNNNNNNNNNNIITGPHICAARILGRYPEPSRATFERGYLDRITREVGK